MIYNEDREAALRVGWITANHASELFDIDMSTVWRWGHHGLIRRIVGVDGVYRYNLDDVQDMERKRRHA